MAEQTPMTEKEAVHAILGCLSQADDEGVGIGTSTMETFEDAGILTYNNGFVLRMPDGSEYQVTVVKSK